jgi:hypothetical protein
MIVKTWSDIFEEYYKTYRHHFLPLQDWLELNYNTPTKKVEVNDRNELDDSDANERLG